jgi:cation diffusion facilitator family transporter
MRTSNEGEVKLKALKISTLMIFSVVIVEVIVGAAANSLAIISDGLHALLDALTSVMLLLAVRSSLKPPDEEHTYGHEKFESIGGLIGGIALIAIACIIFYQASLRILNGAELNSTFGYAGFGAIAYALTVAFLRVIVFRNAQKVQSQSMKAGYYDAISDLGSTILALAGFGLALIGFSGADAVASIILGTVLVYLSLKLTKASIMELSDSASKELLLKTERVILGCVGVLKVDNLKMRKVGSKVFVDATVQVPIAMSLDQAHQLSSKIEDCLKKALTNVDSTIHIEPSDRETRIQKTVQEIAALEGVEEIHEITTNYVEGKRYITLHAQMDPNLSIEEAHRIAENIEKRIYAEIKPLENVTVHIEPAGTVIPTEQINEAKLQIVVRDVARNININLQINRVITYVSEMKRYINIDCCIPQNVQIKEAHSLASRLEKETKDRFSNAVVTVHIEPHSKAKQ